MSCADRAVLRAGQMIYQEQLVLLIYSGIVKVLCEIAEANKKKRHTDDWDEDDDTDEDEDSSGWPG